MSRGQSQSPTRTRRRTSLQGCTNKGTGSNSVALGCDRSEIDVIIIDAQEGSHHESNCFKARAPKRCFDNLIEIDDEDGDSGDVPSIVPGNADGTVFHAPSCFPSSRVPGNAADGTVFHPPSCFPSSIVLDNDEGVMIFAKKYRPSVQENVRVSPGIHHGNHFILDDSDSSSCDSDCSEILTCESDNSDCEIIEDPYGIFHEQWKKAASLRKQPENYQNELEDLCSTSGTNMNNTFPCATTQNSSDEDIDMDDISVDLNRHRGPSEPTIEEDLYSFNHPTDPFFHPTDPFFYPFLSQENTSSVNIDITTRIHNDPTASDTENGLSPPDKFPSKCQKSDDWEQKMPMPGFYDNNSSLYYDIPVLHEGHEYIHAESSLRTAEKQIDGCFQERVVPCPVSSPILDTHCGDLIHEFPGNAALHVKGDQVDGEPSCNHFAEHLFYGNKGSYFEGLPITNKQSAGNGAFESLENENLCQPQVDLIGGRERLKETNENLCQPQVDPIDACERLKETDQYRHAVDQEWAARQRELEIQAEEAHRSRRRKKVEYLRLLEMERRQKLRIEEIREIQKKDMENINLKDHFRAEVRKELDILERRCRDMTSLLRALGIDVKGGHFPLPHEVNAAYKQALLRFHPDRACRAGIRPQVEAEEKFKLISRMKEHLPRST